MISAHDNRTTHRRGFASSRINRGNEYRGFTMIELLVVLVILTIAAGMIIPRMNRSLEGRTLREAAGRFAHLARTVRELAVARQQLCAIEIDLDRGGYGVTMQSRESRSAQMEGIQMSWLKAARWPAPIEVTGYRTPDGTTAVRGVKELRFLKDGTSSGAMIRLASGDDGYVIVVRPHNGSVVAGGANTLEIPVDEYDLGD